MAFRFKKFSIEDDRCSMKVGTDAVILGAWAEIKDGERVLDIGTGSGVIALMLAQRSENIPIDALEIDDDSVWQARSNVLNSPWSGRINIIQGRLQDYYRIAEGKYDLIVSNPPYFEKALRPENRKKRLSRHAENLPHTHLLYAVSRLLKINGRFIVILPCLNSGTFSEKARLEGLIPAKELEIYPRANGGPARVIYEFSREQSAAITKEKLYLKDSAGNITEEYRQLTGDFYLNF